MPANILLSICLLCCLSLCQAAAHNSSRIHFKRLSVNDGMSQSTVLALTQDHNGKIWVGTMDGLNWYDGYRFAPFHKDLNDSTSLSNSHIYSLYTDADGTVWVGTLTGLSRYNIVGNNFTNYTLPEGTPVQIFAIEELKDKQQLLLGTNNGLAVFDKKTGLMQLHPHLQATTVYSIRKANDEVLLGTHTGIYHYLPQDNSIVRLLPELKNEVISSIVYDPRKRVYWMGSFINGVYCMDDKFQIKKHYPYTDRQQKEPLGTVRTLAQDDKGNLWIGTINGLFILEPETEAMEKYTFSHENGNSLGHNSVRSLLKDNQGGIWVGTFYGGLSYYHAMAPAFDTMTYSAYKNSLSDNTVSCIVEDPFTGNLWIGTNDGGLNEYNRRTNHFSVFRANRKDAHALQSDNIKCVLPDDDGVYIGSHGGGLSYLSTRTRQIKNYTFPGAVSFNNSCYSLLDGQDGTIWVGAIIGLYQFNKKTGSLSLHPLAQKHPRLNNMLISVLYRDSKERIWIGTEESLFVYADGKLEEWKDETSRFPALVQAFCIHEDSNHHIWIGSSVGLYKSDNTTPRPLTRYSTYDGLPNNFIYGILEDGRGRLWITTNHGLSCFDPSEQTFLNYSVKDGLSHNQFNTYGACQTKDGIIYLGSLKGITYFNPYQFVDNPYSPNAVITGATIQNQPVTNIRDGVSKYFQASNGKLLGMSFPANRKTFSIRFSVINYLSGRRNLFAYQLEGFDDNWISSAQAISQRGVTYSNLPPGKYTFRVKACNNNGRWSLTPTEFFVHITPMWYQTWWAKTLYVLLTLGGIAFILYFFIARAKMKMQVQIEHLERMKVEEVSQEKVRFYINMSHELRTPLSLILAPLEELVEEKSKFDLQEQQKLSYIYRNGRKLLHLISQLLDFRKAESGALPIHVAMNQVDKLAKNIFTMFEENAQKRNITYEYQSDLKDDLLPVDKMYVEMMLTNLLSNAFKFTRNGGKITLSVWRKENSFGFSVKDNGIGIPQDKLARIFERFYQANESVKGSGIGLSLVKCLVEKHHGTIQVDSQPGIGSRFTVTLPLRKQVFEEDAQVEFILNDIQTASAPTDEETKRQEDTETKEEFDSNLSECHSILVVEDNKELRTFLKNSLSEHYTVITAANGKEGLQHAIDDLPDLIISDVMMPVMDGLEMVKQIKENSAICHIPIIILSAKASLDDRIAGLEQGIDDYITKPFSATYLKTRIITLLRQRKSLQEMYMAQLTDSKNACVSSGLTPSQPQITPYDEKFMQKVMEFMETQMDNSELTIDAFAEHLMLSRTIFYRKLKSIIGLTPVDFIREIRIKRAVQLIDSGEYNFSQIAYMTGFSDPKYFSKCFKKVMGVTPTEYKEK